MTVTCGMRMARSWTSSIRARRGFPAMTEA
jgi:hypothetical protein